MRKILTAIALAHAALAPAQPNTTQYVQGSWVNVRGTAAADGPILTRLTTNSPVQLQATGPRACEVSFGTPAQRGFIACALLGPRPLALADVELPTGPDGTPNPAASPLRAFWIAPSAARLVAAGDHFWQTQLKPAQQAAERQFENTPTASPDKPAPLVRFAVPEFEAMKEKLKVGVVAGNDAPGVWPEWGTAETATSFYGAANGLLRVQLPAVKPSLFRDARQLDGPTSDVEGVSERFRVRERIKVLRGPSWGVSEAREFYARYDGAWDVGAMEVALEQPVVEHVVGRNGLMGAAHTRLVTQLNPHGSDNGCPDGLSWRSRGDTPLPGRPRVKSPLFHFLVPQALTFTQADIRSQTLRVTDAPDDQDYERITRLVLHLVDLDADGVPDFALLEGWRPGYLNTQVRGTDRVLLANIAGRWRLLATDHYVECT